MTMDKKQTVILSFIIFLLGGVIGSYSMYQQQLIKVKELERELEEITISYDSYVERVNTLEDAIDTIMIERTTYIELSFAEIQRLKMELNTTKQLLLNHSIPSS